MKKETKINKKRFEKRQEKALEIMKDLSKSKTCPKSILKFLGKK